MKWLLITCFLIIFSNGLIRAESDNSLEDYCREQYNNQSRLQQLCTGQANNFTEFTDELQTTLVQYSGNNDAVRALADKYCPKYYQLLECSLIGDAVDEVCLTPYGLRITQQNYNISKAMLDYVCANNATAVLLRVLESNGLHTIYENKQFEDCLRFLNSGERIDEKTLGPAAELCDGVDKTFQCYADYVRDHENKHLVTMAKEINVIFRQAIECSPTNEL